MSMQRLTMASNSKCFHVKIFVHYLQRFSLLISDSLELLAVDQYTPVSGQSLQGFIKLVFLILQRFQNDWAAISWPANPIIMFSWHRHQSADCKVIITIPSHSHSEWHPADYPTIRHKKPFRSTALIDRKKSFLVHPAFCTILGQFLDNGGN